MVFWNVPAEPLELIVNGAKMELTPKKFKSGSVGWYLGGKVTIDGRRVQLSFSAVLVGSKPPAELIDVLDEEDLYTSPEKAHKSRKRGRKPKVSDNPSENGQAP